MARKYTWDEDEKSENRKDEITINYQYGIDGHHHVSLVGFPELNHSYHGNIAVKDTKPLDLSLMTGEKTSNSDKKNK